MAPPKSIKLNDGNSIPWLGFGTGTALYSKEVTNLLKAAIQHGFRHLDGAQCYLNEESLGAAAAANVVPREELFITTKLWQLEPGTKVEDSLKESLTKLQTEYVDLFLIHVPLQHQQYEGRLKEVWKEFIEAKRKGLAKSIGVSNFGINHLKEIIAEDTEVPAVNQIEYHPWLYSASRKLLEFQAKLGIVTESYGGLSPILPNRPGDESLKSARAQLVQVLDTLAAARGPSVSRNQIVLKWLQQSGVVVVTTSTKESRIDEYIATEALPDLTEDELKEFHEAIDGVHFRAFPSFKYLDDPVE